MKSLTLLIYGENIPPHKHLHKLGNKFINQFMKARQSTNFSEEEYYEVIVEEQPLNSTKRSYLRAPIIPIHKNYLQNLLNVYNNLNSNIVICTEEHEHPLVYFNDMEYEGYCYYEWNTDKKILFFEISGTKYIVSLYKNSSSEESILEYIKNYLEKLPS